MSEYEDDTHISVKRISTVLGGRGSLQARGRVTCEHPPCCAKSGRRLCPAVPGYESGWDVEVCVYRYHRSVPCSLAGVVDVLGRPSIGP